jgi:hypothetical protein
MDGDEMVTSQVCCCGGVEQENRSLASASVVAGLRPLQLPHGGNCIWAAKDQIERAC